MFFESNENWNNVGVKAGSTVDVFAGYDMPAFWNYRLDTNWLVFSPNVYGELSYEGTATLALQYIEFIFRLKVVGAKFTPLELQWAWDMDSRNRRCYSWSYYRDIFDL